MITLKKLFSNMAYGEFANLNLGDAFTGTIPEAQYDRVYSHVKLGLTALHLRFKLRTAETVIQTYSFIEKYYLRPEYAVSNLNSSLQPILYIEDIEAYGMDTFQDDVFKIEQVFSMDKQEYRINDTTVDVPIYTFDQDCLAITYIPGTPLLNVIYRADHRMLPETVDDPKDIVLQIPSWAVEPLQNYVAHSLLSGMSAGNPEKNLGTPFFARYEFLCKRLEDTNVDPDDNETNTKLEVNGWV